MTVVEATMMGADRVRAGAAMRWELCLRVRELLETGASIRLSIPLGWTPPSLEQGRGLTTWRVVGRALILGEIVRRRYVQLNVTGGRLRPDDAIIVTYGAGAEGAIAQPWVTDAPSTFDVEVSRDGDGVYVPEVSVPVAVDPGPPAFLHVVVPSAARPGVAAPIRIRVLDEFGNLCPSCSDEARLTDRGVVLIAGGCGAAQVVLPHAGVFRIHAAAPGLRLSGRSNPCRVAADAAVPVWGDPHVHTNLSDGVASPEFALRYGRDVACLDFTAITDHDVEFHHAWFTRRHQRLSDEAWNALAEIMSRYRHAGAFVILRAYEWTGRPYGDRCVYLRSDAGSMHRYERDDAPAPDALWRRLGQAGVNAALVVPHTSASGVMGTDWVDHDADLERLVEVYSMHGASECAGGPVEMANAVPGRHVQDALARGYRVGFVGGGDMHSSQPGNPLLALGPYRTLRYKPGLTAVFAGGLDERSIFDAMRDRRTYATTGARIFLWFTVNDTPVGGDLTVGAGQPVVVRGQIHGTADLAEVVVVRNGQQAYVARPLREDFEFAWEDTQLPRNRTTVYYYLRVIQVDGEVAWSSPIWIAPDGARSTHGMGAWGANTGP